jgi:hypothetical protein
MILTQNLRETLRSSRQIIDDWAEQECRRADAKASTAKQQLIELQHTLDETATRLLAVQLERGCQISNDTSGTATDASSSDHKTPTSGLQRLELEQKVQLQTKANARLDDELAGSKRQWKGKLVEVRRQCLPKALISDFILDAHRSHARSQQRRPS